MRSKLILLAVLLVSATGAREARAQDSESRMAVIANALSEIRRGYPGRANLNFPPQSAAPQGISRGISRTEALGVAKRLGYSLSEDPKGFTDHPADIQLAVRGVSITPTDARILVMRAVRQPNGKFAGGAETYAVDLSKVDGRWQVRKTGLFSVQ